MREVFGRPKYAALGVFVCASLLIVMLVSSEFVFFEPYVIGHIPQGTELDLALIIVIAALSGIVVPVGVMSILGARAARKGFAGSMTGTSIAVVAGACSCGPLGFAIASSLGAAGVAASSFLTEYAVPLRLASIAALLVSLRATSKAIKQECNVS